MIPASTQHSPADTFTRRPAAIDRSGMSLRTHFLPDITIVEVRGAVHAGNADRLSDHVDGLAGRDRPLVLDLYGVDFFGGEGFRAVMLIAETCVRKGARWALVTSAAVDRLLRAHRYHGLPTAASLEVALRRLRSRGRAWSPPLLSKFNDRLKSLLTQHVSFDIPDKQIHRWEGEGGALYTPKPPG